MIVVNNNHNSGFSLVELITVIVLLGILGIVALGRFGSSDAIVARAFFDDTLTAVRFAQKFAISSGCEVQVNIAVNNYQLFQRQVDCITGGFTRSVPNPSNRGNDYQNPSNIPDGYTITGGLITFNARGERTESAPVRFTMTDGSTAYAFEVRESTGLVEEI